MKKLLLFLMTVCICFSISNVCYANYIPNPAVKISQTDISYVAYEPDTQTIAEPTVSSETSSDDTSISPEKKKANRSFTILFSGLIGFIVLCIAALIYEKKN